MAPARVSVRIGTGDTPDIISVEILEDGAVRLHAGAAVDAVVTPLDGAAGAYRVTTGDRAATVYVAGPPHRRWVFCEGRTEIVEVEAEDRVRARRAPGHGDALSAPMPATVGRIAVRPGDRVARGDTLLVLEAMKMELPIRAPHDGVIARVHCQEGDLVQPGATLLEFS